MSAVAGSLAVGRVLRGQRRVVEHFLGAGATSPERAIEPGGVAHADRKYFDRLVVGGVLLHGPDGRWYVDTGAWDRFRSNQRMKLLMMLALVLLAVAGFLFWVGVMKRAW